MFKAEEDCIHGRDMVEDFHLSHQAIKIAKRTAWGANTEMQVFAIGVQRGMDEVNQSLAGKDIQISGMETEIKILNEQLIEYRQVLEFYADPENYLKRNEDAWVYRQLEDEETIRSYKHPNTDWTGTVKVGGRRARKALNDLRKGGE